MDFSQLQSYIDKIEEIQDTANEIFTNSSEDEQGLDIGQYQDYANALSDLGSSQAALLLSTQGVTNAQIRQTLAVKGLSDAEQYNAMVEAGLLTSKKSLEYAELQNIIATQVGNEAYAKAIMNHMGLSVATNGEGVAVTKLTARKIQELVATGLLTEAQAQEIAMTTGVTIATKAQASSALPEWIAKLKASTLAVWKQVVATTAWLATNPVGWCIMAATAIASVTAVLIYHSKAAERAQKKINELKDDYSDSLSDMENIENELSEINKRIAEIQSQGKISFTDGEELQNLQKQSMELERQLTVLQEINKQKANDIVSKIRNTEDTLNTDFDKNFDDYQYDKERLGNAKEYYLTELEKGTITQEDYEYAVGRYEDILNQSYGKLLESIEAFESNREAVFNKYNGDSTAIVGSDKQLYDAITNHLQNAYRSIYSKSDYNRLFIEPVFQKGSMKELQQQLVDYFINGGSLDTDALEEQFGTAIITSLKNACEKAGMDFNLLLEDLYNQAVETSYGFAPMPERINSAAEAQQKNNSVQKLNYYNSLDDATKALIINAEVPDSVKNGEFQEFKDWIAALQKEANIKIGADIPDITSSLSDIKDAYSSFESILDEIESGTTVSASSIEELAEEFGDLNDGESLAKFKEVLTTMPDDMDACKESLNQLATEYLDQSDLLQNLTTDNAEYTETELEKLGVANAHAVVQSRLIQLDYSETDAMNVLADCSSQLTDTKDKEKASSIDWANATADEIAWLINEGNAININTTALQSYLRQKIQANEITLTTNGDIQNLITFCSALGSSTKYMQQYAEAKQKLSLGQSLTGYWKGDDEYLYQLEIGAKRELEKALSNSTNINYTPSLPSLGSASTGSTSQAKDTVKQYNWIETAMNRVKEALSRLTRVRDNTYANWSKRNTALNSEITKITEQLHLQQQAYNHYMAEADSVGLSQDYLRKLQSGAIQVEDISDEGLQNQIDRYQDWYDQALECSDAIEELTINLSELAQQKFDSLQTEFEALISTFTAQADVMEERISRTEAQGYFADKHYYEELIAYENQELASLRREYNALQTALREAIDTGRIEAGSEAWHKMRAELLDVEQSIEESTTALVEFQNEIRNLSWDIFDYIADRIGQITQESDFLIDLLEHGSLYETTGAFTSQGMAAAALHGVNYNTWLQQSLDYAEALRQMEADLANDPQNKDLIERREALLKLQQDAITSAEAEKDAIQSLVEDGMKLHLDALSQLIDKYKEGLSAAKDLQDYRKNISEQTADIAGLEKIMLAYQGDDSEEARKLLQDTQNQLQDARQELEETEWERYISETEDLLDALYDEYETILNQRLDNIDALIADMIDMVNAGSTDIREAIEATAFKAGYDISSTMQTIFGSGGSQTTLLSTFLNRFDTASTTLQKAVNDIKASIQTRMTAPAGADGIGSTDSMSGIGSNSGLNIGNSGASASGSPTPQASTPQGDGTVGIGDLVTFASGRYHEDSWGNGRSGAQNLNGQVYITKIKPDSPYPYHISRGAGLGNGDLGWVKLEQLKGYRYGARRIHGNQWAWTQEDGRELIRTSSGAILTPLGNGDTVFTNEMTQRLWELSNGSIPITGLDIHTMAHRPELPGSPQVVNNSNAITITLPNVTNYAEFKQELQRDNRFIGFVQEVTSGQALGNPRLNRRKY
ncbi:MAG: hypothetical protein NC089_13025 [Bacteroides sp.]|nr:hypothetical protein [Bacteroides sp.]MCM1550874.1 hypothetical protein [Clostridium sp.]